MSRRLAEMLAAMQGDVCPTCGEPLLGALSVDHVWPRLGRQALSGLYGNALASHPRCNSSKGDRDPTGCEIVWLTAVNALLGVEPRALTVEMPAPSLASLWPTQ